MAKATVAPIDVGSRTAKESKKIAEVAVRVLPSNPKPPDGTERVEDVVTDPEELLATIDAMDEYVQLSRVIGEAELRQKELKATLTGVAMGAGIKAYQSADIKVSVSVQSRSTFDKAKMLEHVTASVLDSCYAQGAEFYVTKVEVRKK